MSVIVKNNELEVLGKNGISDADIHRTIASYRNEGLPDEEIRTRLDKKLSEFAPQTSLMEKATDMSNGIYQGFTGGFSDELAGHGKGIVYGAGDMITGRGNGTFGGGFARGYQEGRDTSRTEYDKSQERNSTLTTAGEIAGGFSNPVMNKGGKFIAKGGNLGVQLARSAKVGGGYGGLYGAGTSKENTVSGVAQDVALNGIVGAGLGAAFPLAGAGMNKAVVKFGKRNIENQLRSGVFKDVNFGKITNDKVEALNKIRGLENVANFENGKLTIPENVMKHFYERRIKTNGMAPEEVSAMLEQAFHSKNSQAIPGKYPHIQALVDFESNPSNVGFVGKHSKTGNTIVKGGYRKSRASGFDGSLGGAGSPSTKPDFSRTPVAETALQGVDGNIAQNNPVVKPEMRLSKMANESIDYNPNLDDSAKKAVKNMNVEYEVLHDPVLQRRSLGRVQTDFNGVVDSIDTKAKNGNYVFSADDFEDVRNVVARLFAEGRDTKALELIEVASKQGSKAGQSVHALALWNKATPEGAVKNAQNLLNKYNEQFKKTVKITTEQAQSIRKLQENVMRTEPGTREYDTAVALSLKAQMDVVPKTMGQKIASYRNISMLLNPKTILRNIGGNTIFNGVDKGLTDYLANAVDFGLSKFTGKRTWSAPQWSAYAGGMKKGIKEGIEDVQLGINTRKLGGKYDLQSTSSLESKIGKSFEKMLNYGLQVPDRAFYEATFQGSVKNQMRAQGLTKPTADILKVAEQEALESVFQNNGLLSQMALGLRKGINKYSKMPLQKMGLIGEKSLGLGDFLMPFAQVPANLTQQALNYSPLGVVKALTSGSQRQASKDIARALVGTGAMGGAYGLAKKGYITGDLNDDSLSYQNNLERKSNLAALGVRPFQIGGTSYNMFSPLSTALSAGAKLGQGSSPLNAIGSAAQTVAEMPFLQGINRMTKTYNRDGLVSALSGVASDVPGQFVPTALNQIADVINPSVRETYDRNVLKQGLNKAINKIPFARDILPQKNDVTGRPMRKYDSTGAELFYDALVNPTFNNKRKFNPVVNELNGLYGKTGETGQFLPVAKRKFSYTDSQGEKQDKVLSGQELSDYQKELGKSNEYLLDQLFRSPYYQSLSDKEKIDEVTRIQKSVDENVKTRLFGIYPNNKRETATDRANKKAKKLMRYGINQ